MLPEIVYIAMAFVGSMVILGSGVGYAMSKTYTSILLVSVTFFILSLFLSDIVINNLFAESVKNLVIK